MERLLLLRAQFVSCSLQMAVVNMIITWFFLLFRRLKECFYHLIEWKPYDTALIFGNLFSGGGLIFLLERGTHDCMFECIRHVKHTKTAQWNSVRVLDEWRIQMCSNRE